MSSTAPSVDKPVDAVEFPVGPVIQAKDAELEAANPQDSYNGPGGVDANASPRKIHGFLVS